MPQSQAKGRARPRRASRAEPRQHAMPSAAPAPEEHPSIEAYMQAFRSVVTPERLRTMALDLIADFDEQETPLKDKFAVWNRFAAYAIGTPTRQAETSGDDEIRNNYLKALLDALGEDSATSR